MHDLQAQIVTKVMKLQIDWKSFYYIYVISKKLT